MTIKKFFFPWNWFQELLKYQIEAAWQLGQWQEIEDNCSKIETRDWSSNLGELLLSAQKQNLDTLQRQVDNLKKEQIIPIGMRNVFQKTNREIDEPIFFLYSCCSYGTRCLSPML